MPMNGYGSAGAGGGAQRQAAGQGLLRPMGGAGGMGAQRGGMGGGGARMGSMGGMGSNPGAMGTPTGSPQSMEELMALIQLLQMLGAQQGPNAQGQYQLGGGGQPPQQQQAQPQGAPFRGPIGFDQQGAQTVLGQQPARQQVGGGAGGGMGAGNLSGILSALGMSSGGGRGR